ncbi:MAG: T9SS type A sorting domain-containing protein [Saprospiraceae bacterium]
MVVSEKDISGEWTILYSYPNVEGSSFTVTGLESGKQFRFRIATKCPLGDPSELTAFFDDHTAIVELTLAGRKPKDPTPINGIGIEYQSYHWVGFEVFGEDASNIFEVKVNEGSSDPIAYIKRVVTANPIVAADNNGAFPNDFFPTIKEVKVPFKMIRLTPNYEIIGRLQIAVNTDPPNPPTLDLYIENPSPFPWKSTYTFRALIANSTILDPPGGGGGQGLGKGPTNERFEVQNPFKDNLHVFVSKQSSTGGKATMRMMNINGQVVLEQKFDCLSSEVSIPVEWLAPGVYILQIETDFEAQTLKLIKSE